MNSPKTKNSLAGETSPYLLQHADNPVEWYPWGEEALQKAKDENRPIFLSIGYSSCHWCHVMAHESFEDPAIAQLMNQWFVNIKVDREERPDVDTIYMKALVSMIGHGGWPMSLFLTPAQEPYFGGTYFPPTPKFNRPGFPQILQQARDLYLQDKEKLKSRVGQVLQRLGDGGSSTASNSGSAKELMDDSVHIMTEKYDEEYGGFGAATKFPEPMIYSLLLLHWLRGGSQESLLMADRSLTKMAEGGMFDQLGGGFHRYSTDRLWKVPHFEKMLYDNALLARLYLEAFQATKQDFHSDVAKRIFEYVLREMTSPEGGFYSSQDADTEGGEGRFFLWELKEVLDLLGPRNAKVIARHYGMSAPGNFDRKNILHINEDLETIAKSENIPIFEINHIVNTGRKALFEARGKRRRPETDTKILAGWNGMMTAAFAKGYSVLRDRALLETAQKAGEFVWKNMWTESGLLRVYKDGQAKIPAFLEDYAWTMEAFLNLYEASFDLVWIERARDVADRLIADFWDEDGGGFFMTGRQYEKLIHRPKISNDEAVPSANAIAAQALTTLGRLTGEKSYLEKAEAAVAAFRGNMEGRPASHNGFLCALDYLTKPPAEIVIAGPKDHPEFEKMIQAAQQDLRPEKLLIHADGEAAKKLLPLAEGKSAPQGEPAAWVCQNQTCHPPATSAEALTNLLEKPPMIKLNIFDRDKDVAEKSTKENANFLGAMSQIFKHSGLGPR